MSIGKIRNLNSGSGGGTVNLLDTLTWVSLSPTKEQFWKNSDGSMYFGQPTGNEDSSGGSITSSYFMLKKTDTLQMVSKYYRGSNWGHGRVYLYDSSNTLIDSWTDDNISGEINRFVTFSKTGLQGNYRWVFSFGQSGGSQVSFTVSKLQIN